MSKTFKYICINCIEHNRKLGNVNANFKINCEYGACDVCGEFNVVVHYERYFNQLANVEPYTNDKINIKELFEKVEALSKKPKKIDQKQEQIDVEKDEQ